MQSKDREAGDYPLASEWPQQSAHPMHHTPQQALEWGKAGGEGGFGGPALSTLTHPSWQ